MSDKLVTVPVEPTDEMVDAACDAANLYRVDFVRAYEAALAAAPASTAQAPAPNIIDFHNGDAAMWIEDGKVKSEWNKAPATAGDEREALVNLVNQIRKVRPVDELGHSMLMNRAYLEAVKLLDSGAASAVVIRDEMKAALGCFEAAEIEGLAEALAETSDAKLKDLVERRLMHAVGHIEAALSAPAQQSEAAQAPGRQEPVCGKSCDCLAQCGDVYEHAGTAAPSQPPQPEARKQDQEFCGCCGGSGRMVRDPDIGTDQECFACDGTGKASHE